VSYEKQTWCDHEIVCEPKDLEITLEDRNRESPTVSVMSFALKTFKSKLKHQEIAMISCLVHDKVNCDNNTPNPKSNYKFFSMLRKV
jgi:DNA polymerase alpha subunit A